MDEHALPTRRARSLEALASLGGSDSTAMLKTLAYNEQEPPILRMSAVRGLGQLLPESQLIVELRPLLGATHRQLRGAAAQVLSHVPGGCAAVRELAGGESEAWRARFALECDESGSSPGRVGMAPENSSRSVARIASPAAAVGPGQFIIPLGLFAVFTDQLSLPITVNIPATANSFEFVEVTADPTARVVVARIVGPSGNVIYTYSSSTNIGKIQGPSLPGSFSVLLPNSPTVPFHTGTWTFYLLGAKATTANVHVVFRTLLAPVINANLFFVGVPNLAAKSARTVSEFSADSVKSTEHLNVFQH